MNIRSASLVLLLLSACRNKADDTASDTSADDTGSVVDTSDTGDTADTALDDEDLPETTVTVEQDLVWDEDVSLGSVVYVPEGIKLTVEPGVSVKFKPGGGIIVDGTLLLNGTEQTPVKFLNDYTLSSANYGVSVGGTGDASVLNYTSFKGINITLEGGATAGITGASFSDSTLSVLSREDRFTLKQSSFTDNERDGQVAISARDVTEMVVDEVGFDHIAVGVNFNGLSNDATLVAKNLSFSDVSTAIYVGNLGDYQHTVEVENVTVEDASSNGMAFYRSQASLLGVTINGALSNGIYADASSSMTLRDISVDDVGGSCINLYGSSDIDGAVVAHCEANGIYAGELGATVANVKVSNIDNIGVYATGDMTVSGAEVTGTPSHGIYANGGSLTVSDSVLTDISGSAVYANAGDLVVSDTTVDGAEGHGLYSNTGDLEVTDVQVTGVRGQGVYAYRGDLTVNAGRTGSVITDIEGTALYANDGDVYASGVSISDIRGYGVYAYYGDATVENSTIQKGNSTGIYAVQGDIHAGGRAGRVTVTDVEGSGLYANTGNLYADGVDVVDTRSHAFYAYYGDLEVSDVTAETVGGTALYAYLGDATIDGAEVAKVTTYGAYVYKGTLTASELNTDDTGSYGIYVNRGDADLSDVTVQNADATGIYVQKGSLTIDGATVSVANGHGIYANESDFSGSSISVNEVEGTGVYVYDAYGELSDAEISNVLTHGVYYNMADGTIEDVAVLEATGDPDAWSAGGDGVAATNGYVLIDNVLVEKAETYGLYMEEGEISSATVRESGSHGIYVFGHNASELTRSVVEDAGYYGIIGISWGDNGFDVTYSNVSGSWGYGIANVQTVDHCYVADNDDYTGADTDSGGSLDGSRDVDTDQIANADVVSNPQSSAVSGAGSSL